MCNILITYEFASDYRYKDSKGDPRGFKLFLIKKNLPLGLIPRYRGNRLNIFFVICGVLFRHHSDFVELLKTGTACGGLRTSLRKDFESSTLLNQIHVAGLIGKIISGPWMRHFYRDAGHQVSYVQGIEDVRKAISRLTSCSPLDLLTWKTDCFNDPLPPCDILNALQSHPPSPQFEKSMQDCLSAIVNLLNRQYKKQFESDTDDLIQVTKSSRANNIHSEQVMGMLSASIHRAPAATVAYHSCKIRAQKNETLPFVGNCQDKEGVIAKARSLCGRVVLKNNIKNQKTLLEELMKRQTAKEALMDQKARSKMERLLKKGDVASNFPQLSADELETVKELLEGRSIDRTICHVWDEGIYTGRLLKYTRSKCVYKVSYWSTSEEDPTDYDVKSVSLAVDFILGDLTM